MIRRPPTRIAMADSDVQDIRDMVVQKRADAEAVAIRATQMSSGKGKARDTTYQPYVAAEDAKRKREAISRDERLGLR